MRVVLSMQATLQMKDEDKSSDQDSNSGSQEAQQDNEHDEQEGEKNSRKDSGYTFNLTETTILEVVMDSMRTCGLALALQALSTVLLGRMQEQHNFQDLSTWCLLLATQHVGPGLSSCEPVLQMHMPLPEPHGLLLCLLCFWCRQMLAEVQCRNAAGRKCIFRTVMLCRRSCCAEWWSN